MDNYINFLSDILFNFSFGDTTTFGSLTVNGLIHQSGLSLIYLEIFHINPLNKKILIFFYLIFLGTIVDLLLFKLGNHLNKSNKQTKARLSYLIFLRYIPLIGYFGALFSGLYYKKISKKITIIIISANILFGILNLLVIYLKIK